MSEKELEEYLEKLIDKQFTTKYAGAEQAQRIAKDIKNGSRTLESRVLMRFPKNR